MPTTLKTINDKCFIIEDGRGFVGNSDTVFHSNCDWYVRLEKTTHCGLKYLSLSLNCSDRGEKLWKLNAKVTFTLIKPDGTRGAEKSFDACFERGQTRQGLSDYLLYQELEDNYLDQNRNYKSECKVEVTSFTDFQQKSRIDFQVNDDLKDVALVVEGKKLFVNKAVLATFSPVFRAMFFSGFKESTDKEIIFKDAKYEDFEQFLQVIHSTHSVSKGDIKNLMILADRYDTAIVREKCENWLISTEEATIGDKLEFAERYSFSFLYEKCMNSINNKESLQKAHTFVDQLGVIALRDLAKKTKKYY